MNWLDVEQFLLSFARSLTGLGVNWLIQSTLLLVFGLAAARMLRGHGSAVQSVVYRATLAAVLACPLVTAGLSLLGASGWSLAMPAAFTYANVDSAPSPSNEAREATQADAATRSESSATAFNPLVIDAPVAPAESPSPAPIAGMSSSSAAGLTAGGVAFSDSSAARQAVSSGALAGETSPLAVRGFGLLAATFAAAWIAVASCLLLRLVVAWRELKKIRQQGVQAEPVTMELCRALAFRLGVRPPNVMHSPYVPGPCLSGLRQPAVMLPESDLGLSLRDVLIHELAHLRRHDCHWNLLRRAGTALFWFQPMLWKLSALLEATAEEVCDDHVVQFGGDRSSYARRLVDIAELSSAPFPAASVGMVSLRSMLSRRVARILDTSRSLSTRAGGTVLALVLVVGVLGTLAAGLVGLSDSAAAETTVDAGRGTNDASPAGSSDENNTLESAQQDVAGTVPDPADKPLNAAKAATGAESPAATGNETPDATKLSAAVEPIRGRVASADGKPVSGAKLYWGTWTLRGIQTPAELAATTDAEGNFDFTPPDAALLNNDSPEQILNRMLVVVAPGHGMAVTNQIPAPLEALSTPLQRPSERVATQSNCPKMLPSKVASSILTASPSSMPAFRCTGSPMARKMAIPAGAPSN